MALDAQGWTILTPSGDSRLIYVSTSGSDSNDGLSDTTPKQTIAAGMALLRDGYPDWLQLKCGDTWDEGIGWGVSGRSASEPMVITSYSTGARPLLRRASNNSGFNHSGGTRRAYLCIVDIHFLGRYGTPTAAGGVGIQVTTPIDDLIVEGCVMERFLNGASFEEPDGNHYRVQWRRNVLIDNHSTDSQHGQGTYFGKFFDGVIEENIYDTNGWLPGDPNATGATIFRHGLYIQSNGSNVVVRNNYVLSCPSHGIQLRPGGTLTGNIITECAIGAIVANDNDPTGQVCTNNIVMQGHDIDGSNTRGWGFEIQDFSAGEVGYNLVTNQDTATGPIGMIIRRAPGAVEVHHNIIWDWLGTDRFGVLIDGTAAQVTAVDLHDNDVQEHNDSGASLVFNTGSGVLANVTSADNRFYRTPSTGGSPMNDNGSMVSVATWKTSTGDTTSTETNVSYTDTTRDLGAYNGYIGGTATLAAFKTALRAQRKGAWDTDYDAETVAAWIRAGWDMVIPGGGGGGGGGAQAVRVMALRQNTAIG